MLGTRERLIFEELHSVSLRVPDMLGELEDKTLSSALLYLFRPLWCSLRLSLIESNDDLTEFWSFARVIDA